MALVQNLGSIIPNYYHYRRTKKQRRSAVINSSLLKFQLKDIVLEANVKWMERQKFHRRVKRDFQDIKPPTDPLYSQMWYLDPLYKKWTLKMDYILNLELIKKHVDIAYHIRIIVCVHSNIHTVYKSISR